MTEIPNRPNLIARGILWGAILGFVLTLLGAFGLGLVAYFTTPDIEMDSEMAGYLLFVAPFFACGIAVLPLVVSGAIGGGALGIYYQRLTRRHNGLTPLLIGVAVAVLLFIIGFALVYAFLGGSPVTNAGNLDMETNQQIALWTGPFLLVMIVGFGWLSTMLNKHVPEP